MTESLSEPRSFPTRATITKFQPKCAVCAHPACGEVTDYLALRAGKEKVGGELVTFAYVQAIAPDKWGSRFSERSLSRHWTNHCAAILPAIASVAAELEKQAAGEIGEVLGQLDPATSTSRDFLRGTVAAAVAKLKSQPQAVTIEQGMTASRLLAQKELEDEQANLMQMLGAVVADGANRDREQGKRWPTDRPHTVDAEVVAEEIVDAEVIAPGPEAAAGE